jgi:hypothetical protein
VGEMNLADADFTDDEDGGVLPDVTLGFQTMHEGRG